MVDKMHKVMHEFKHGELHSGSKKGPEVKSRDQAIAIGLSEARKAGQKMAKGGRVLEDDDDDAEDLEIAAGAVHKHERGMHKGKTPTKFNRGGPMAKDRARHGKVKEPDEGKDVMAKGGDVGAGMISPGRRGNIGARHHKHHHNKHVDHLHGMKEGGDVKDDLESDKGVVKEFKGEKARHGRVKEPDEGKDIKMRGGGQVRAKKHKHHHNTHVDHLHGMQMGGPVTPGGVPGQPPMAPPPGMPPPGIGGPPGMPPGGAPQPPLQGGIVNPQVAAMLAQAQMRGPAPGAPPGMPPGAPPRPPGMAFGGKVPSLKGSRGPSFTERMSTREAGVAPQGNLPGSRPYKKGGKSKKYAKGGRVHAKAHRRGDGIAQKGYTVGKVC